MVWSTFFFFVTVVTSTRVTEKLAPSVRLVASLTLTLSSASTLILAAAKAAPTVCAVVLIRRFVPAWSTVIVFRVARLNDSPFLPIAALRLVDSWAPEDLMSSDASA